MKKTISLEITHSLIQKETKRFEILGGKIKKLPPQSSESDGLWEANLSPTATNWWGLHQEAVEFDQYASNAA